ncbi:dipeptide epimerase [Mesorhizobium sp. M4B.F.Ca.ET.215.01.1.1]|uniref:N-acetyl-D-Glu racemase DgcA n=1 Tax=unclassified Mesorhizobium TaxID=325217 RepID=UPI000FC9E433|nr:MULTISPECIES: N-acetyl-D-Glu racemase DgcA [unclassified Mesorhizobium]RUW18985.1 dipeptide epimerase [Mesorhizobium sp. M4B.F.Ca.ET.013.02.1.1]RVD34847.1 dipeptide epimerase [Mesorhizobium sp. M4B.F.Ca.ET.019.03.1.1]RWF65165.1 MAG: dipeptide epimerase [Mesorhizobium sp.]TGQ08142.1 dipeptide epimerase [Mesorhizobium sp. M4B.F.Ca.ET.215.01.1.1]TGQ32943.1 dipeptide epimerase [Mesorhizobium sp. M4B.F.Ca.ET.214.01.1.1]
MARVISVESERFPITGAFTISRGSKTEAEVITVTIRENGHAGRGECVPYKRYGETMDGVQAAIEAMRGRIADGIDRAALIHAMPAGAARNAIDCALWDLEAKLSGAPVAHAIRAVPLRALETAFTLSLGEPEAMAAQARANAARPLLKVKIGGDNDKARIRAVTEAAPGSRIILDANEGWTEHNIVENLAFAAEQGIALIEQPLPAGRDEILREIAHPVPICADESVHEAKNLDALVGLYDAVNIKLDKTGGLTAALVLRDRARELGFDIMVGCMVGTSLAMAPAVLLAQDADFVDLDGPLLLARDRAPGLVYQGSLVSPPDRTLWG